MSISAALPAFSRGIRRCLSLIYRIIVFIAAAMKIPVSNHFELRLVKLKECSLGYLDSDVLSALLDGTANVKTLLLEECSISTKESVKVVAKYLAKSTALTIFDFGGNNNPPSWSYRTNKEDLSSNAKSICKGLEKNKNMCQLSLRCTNIEIPTFLKRRDGICLKH